MKILPVVAALAAIFAAFPAHAQQYVVKLTWTASTDAAANPSLTYNVYRASACAGHFVQINVMPVTTTSFIDSGVASGAAYCYQVTAVLSGLESAPSNHAFAAAPPPADRQATCAHHGPVIGWIRCLGSRPKRSALPGS